MNGRTPRREARAVRRILGLGLAFLMVGSLVQAASLPSAVAEDDGPPEVAEEQLVEGRDGLPVVARPIEHSPRVPLEDPRADWPEAAPAQVRLPATGPGAALPARAGDLPVWLQSVPGQAPLLRRQEVTAEVTVLDRDTTEAAGVDGVLFTVEHQPASGGARSAGQPVDVRLGYEAFAEAYGGGYGARLSLYQLPACALTTPDVPECRERVPLETVNDTEQETLSAQALALQAGEPLVLAAAADEASVGGDYTATELSPSSTWDVGLNTGDFSWSYDIPVPDVPGGLTPNVGISYSSGAIDGRTRSTNNQGSWIGDGFDMWPGYIERRYQSCAEEGVKNASGNEVGDLCWEYDNAFISFNGQAGELVPAGTNEWRFQRDDGTRIRRLESADRANGDNDNEYWELTATDGTRYYFGYHRLPGWASGNETTDSTWTVPVFGNDSGEECHASTMAASWCQQAWRWNLDYVVDPHGNAIAYYYDTEVNYYGRFLDAEADTRYVRGGFLDRIDYGLTNRSSVYAQQPLATVDFTSSPRCLPADGVNCALTAIDANKQYWYDTPWDLNCNSGATCDSGRFSPTFWTRYRLTGIATRVLVGTSARSVDSWTLAHRWGSADVDYQLLLDSIRRTGQSATSAVTLPPTTFGYTQLANRLDRTADGWAPFIKERLSSVSDETGGHISVDYSAPACSFDSLPTPQTNTTRCFPQYLGGGVNEDPELEWFNKYVVTSVSAMDRTGGSPTQVTRYEYLGGAAWHYDDDNGLVPDDEKTWSQWRGYGQVRVMTGGQGSDGMISQQDTFFLRGMNGDRRDPSGGTRSVTVTLPDGEGEPIPDERAYQGFAYRTVTYDGVDGPVLERTVSRPWHHETARSERSWGVLTANFTGEARSSTWTSLDDGAGVRWRTTRVDTEYDVVAGRPVEVNDLADTTTTADDRCTRTTYLANTGSNILAHPSREETVAVNCDATPNRAEDVLSDVRYAYDGRDYGVAPTIGDVTRTAVIKEHDGTTARYLESGATYDAYGRELTSTDLTANVTVTGSTLTRTARTDGRTATTAYNPTSGFPTEVTETTPPANPSVASTAQQTITRIDARRGVPTSIRDTNGLITTLTYDALGRSWRVWLPDNPTDEPPSYEFLYRITEGQPVSVVTRTLDNAGGQRVSNITLYDGFLRPRQTQVPGPENGRLVSDILYDVRGLVEKTYVPYPTSGVPEQSIFNPTNAFRIESQTWHTYDALGREIESRDVAGNGDSTEVLATTRTSYLGDRTTVIPPVGATATTTLFDARGQTTELRQHHQRSATAAFDTTRYTYTPAGQLHTVTDPAGNQWTYDYDLLGRTVETTDPDAGRTTSTYNDRNELTRRTNARGITLAYVYDNLSRQTQLRENSATGRLRAQWVYDTVPMAEGQLARSVRYDAAGNAYTNQVVEYDPLYRPTVSQVVIPTSETGLGGTYQTGSTYYSSGLPLSTNYPEAGSLPSTTQTFTYDDHTLWLSMTSGSGYESGLTYTRTGKPSQYTMNRGPGTRSAQVTNEYEPGTQRLAATHVWRENQPGLDRSEAFTYDEAGNVLSISDTSTTGTDVQCFQYDYLRRLTEAWSQLDETCASTPSDSVVGGPAAYWNSYTYDLVGNRLTETLHEEDTERTYDYPEPGTPQPHTVTSVTEEAPGITSLEEYGYDQAGNTTTRQIGGDTQTLTWDAEGHLASVEEADGTTTEYLYDADGNRLISRSGTERTLYLGHTEVTYDSRSGFKQATRYFDLGGGHTAVQEDNGDISFTIADHHGTGQLAINAETLAISQRRTLPFGEIRGEQPASWPGSRGFVGGISDDTGLTHLGAREYDPALGRFISLDPIMDLLDPQQIHGYTYASNNPVTLSDPTGLIQDGCWTGGASCSFDGQGKVTSATPPKHASGLGSSSSSNSGSGGSASSSGGGIQQVASDDDDDSGGGNGNPWLAGVLHNPLRGISLDWSPGNTWDTLVEALAPDPLAIIDECASGQRNIFGCTLELGALAPGVGRLPRLAEEAIDAAGDANRRLDDVPTGCPVTNSFIPGTHVQMADGSSKPIEDVQIGDHVLATDPETGETSSRVVTAEIRGDGLKELVNISVLTDEGRSETITATSGHPFWVTDLGRWLDAGDLEPGAELLHRDGSPVTVLSVSTVRGKAVVFNLTVEGVHAYYVLAGRAAVLVHNSGGCPEDAYEIEGHVIPRHTRGGAEADATKSLFDEGVDLGELAAGSAGQIGHYQSATGNIRYFIEASGIVGTDRHGLPTRAYTVIRDGRDGELITMHPGLPRDLDP
jgi:RHS repeat-associated protein